MGAALVEMAAVREAQRQREYELLDSCSIDHGRTARRCEIDMALEMRRMDGDMKKARLLLRGALSCVKDYAAIYRAWIDMELETEHGGDGVGAARGLFEDWETTLHRAADSAKAGSAGDVAKDKLAAEVAKYERADYWCAYIVFEVRHGTAESARNVAKRAVKACTGDELVRAMCAKVQEMAMAVVDEQQRRHRLGLIRGAKKWLGTIFAPTSTPSASGAAAAYHGSPGCRVVRAGS